MLALNNSFFSLCSNPYFPFYFQNCKLYIMSVSLIHAVDKPKIRFMFISVYSKIPWKQMVSFALWFPVSFLSRELSVALALCTRCKNSTLHWLRTQTVRETRPTEEARLLCPCLYSPTGCQLQILSAETQCFTSWSMTERMDNLFPSNSNKQKSAAIS